VFVGEYKISFLGKGRIALPKKIRNQLSGNRVVLTRGFENCVFGYERSDWEKAAQIQIQTPVTEEKGRAIRRYLFSGAMVSKFDSQGRVVIPPFLLEYAKIDKEVVVIGAGDHFEIWNVQAWEKELGSIEAKKL